MMATMLALIAVVAIQASPVPARESRAAFAQALRQVDLGWKQVQVRNLLGPPDDVWPKLDSVLLLAGRYGRP